MHTVGQQTAPIEPSVKPILDWLAHAHSRTGLDGAAGLVDQLQILRKQALPLAERLTLLDLLYSHAAKVVLIQLPSLHTVTLPISHRTKQIVRTVQDILSNLAQDYLDALGNLQSFRAPGDNRFLLSSLHRVMRCLSWHLLISELVAASPGIGIWQQFHSVYRNSYRLGLANTEESGEQQSIEKIYLHKLVTSIAQPASFTSRELAFINQYVNMCVSCPQMTEAPPFGPIGVFWIDSEQDVPAQALMRRSPPPGTAAFYFTCDLIAQEAAKHLAALEEGKTAAELNLPPFADSHECRGVLRRLTKLWGRPVKRAFPRRQQSYRADLYSGLDQIWPAFNGAEEKPDISEWVVTDESPNGYAMMHFSGNAEQLRVGDIIAVNPHRAGPSPRSDWHICVVRWALSDNPEHIKVGLQILSPSAMPVVLALPETEQHKRQRVSALLLPKAPPLRQQEALVVPSGAISHPSKKMYVLVEMDNIEVREMRTVELDEQTSRIEVFTVASDESL